VLDLEDSALGNGKAGNLPGVPDDDEIEIHLLVSAHPRGHRPAIHVMDVFFRELTILLFPEHSPRVGATGELDDGKFCAVRNLNSVLLRVEPYEWPAIAVANQGSP
jgi:hypothetical protein